MDGWGRAISWMTSPPPSFLGRFSFLMTKTFKKSNLLTNINFQGRAEGLPWLHYWGNTTTKEEEKKGAEPCSSAPLGTRRARRVRLGHTPRPPPHCRVLLPLLVIVWVWAARLLLHPSSWWVGSACFLLRLVALGWAAILSSSLYSLLCVAFLSSAFLPSSCRFSPRRRFCSPPRRFCFLLVVSVLLVVSALPLLTSTLFTFVVSALLVLFAVCRSHWDGGVSDGVGMVQPSPPCRHPRPLSLATTPLSLHRWNSRARVFAAYAEAGVRVVTVAVIRVGVVFVDIAAGVRIVAVAVVRVGVVFVDIAAIVCVINVLGARHCAEICGV
jgi:hypothetical protein